MLLELALLCSLAMGSHLEITTEEVIIIDNQIIVCQVCGRDATRIETDNGQISAWCDEHDPVKISDKEMAELLAWLKLEADCGYKSRDADKVR
jgi:hypothetical protein